METSIWYGKHKKKSIVYTGGKEDEFGSVGDDLS